MPLKHQTSVVIFDCDGVMFDSRQANTNFYNHLLSHFGLPPLKESDIAYVHMHTADESVRHIFRGTPYADKALSYRMDMDYSPFIEDMIMEQGLKELLEMLKPVFGLGVATNRSNTIGTVLDSNGLTEYFDIVVSSLDVKHPKPHPESLYKVLDFFRIRPEQAMYVGDSLVDLETAAAAGIPFIAYKNPSLVTDCHVERLLDLAVLLHDRDGENPTRGIT